MFKDQQLVNEVVRDLAKFSGLVVGRNGKGGSGTCVQFNDGTVGLLTAKHVVIECLRNTGEVFIAIPFSRVGFQRPRAIRMDSSQQGDAAILIFNNLTTEIPTIPFASWTVNHTEIAVGDCVFACGFPGALQQREVIREELKWEPRFAYVGDYISSVESDVILCGINETIDGIPSQLGGMSGGGLFSSEGDFLGIVIEESRRLTSSHGELRSLRPSAFVEIYKPFSMPSDAPDGGFYAERRSFSLDMLKPDNSGVLATIGIHAELFWSKTNSEHRYGRIGRLTALEFIFPGIETHYPINIESLFYWDEDTEMARTNAIEDEFKFLLLRMGWLLNYNGENGQPVLKVNPMV